LKNSLRKWFFKEPWFERFFVEPEMVLLCHHSEEPFSVPDGTSMFLCSHLYSFIFRYLKRKRIEAAPRAPALPDEKLIQI